MNKRLFEKEFSAFCNQLTNIVCDKSKHWTIKGFIDSNKNIYTISQDTKIISKILEIHIFPEIINFAEKNEFDVILTDHQNYYPDISFVYKKDTSIKYAVDIKTTFTKDNNKAGFTLGSHGTYFINRNSTKNIQFPYSQYKAHFVLGILYERNEKADERTVYKFSNLDKINSVIKNMQFFFAEKWKIASDKQGSGNTANIGSITNVDDLKNGAGPFTKYKDGEKLFDEYWMNYNKISVTDKNGKVTKINTLNDFLEYRGDKQCQ